MTPTPVFARQKFEGTASQSTDEFWLNKGTATFYIIHSGSGEFKVRLWSDKYRRFIETLVETKGQFENILHIALKEGDTYLLDICADAGANWLIEVDQP